MDWLKLAQEAYEASTSYIEANYRGDWEYSLNAFRNEHSSGSKYVSEEFKHRSKIFTPYTRTIIRKNEAAGAVALFSNLDVVDVTPNNPDDMFAVANAECVKQLLQYRLTKTIPAFPLVMGAIQDAQTTGNVCSYQYWEYKKHPDGRVIKDQPCIELRPIENIRLDAGASWLDPVNSSPYFCDVIPMYVCDIKALMNQGDEKTGTKFKKYEDAVICKAKPDRLETVRKARIGNEELPEENESDLTDFEIVWVMRWFIKDSEGFDYTFYTLGTEELLTDPKPIEEVYFHGKRPYVIGCAIIETHKPLKQSIPVLVRPLQQEGTEVTNQRLDNVKFVLNKRWLVARGRQVDVQSLVRNVPGGVTLTTDPNNDIRESNWPDVTSSSYAEQDRIKGLIDDLAGNFSPNTRVANNAMNDTLGGSKIALQGAGIMTDYLLRTIIETWWEPVLRQLVLLEQYYETDQNVLAVCAQKARLFNKFGISRITDDLLLNEVSVNVNVGMGASNPDERFKRFMMATQAAMGIAGNAPPNFNVQEAVKEIYSNAGYRDGSRFFSGEQDPRLVKAMQTIQQLQGALQGKQMEMQANMQLEERKIQSNEKIKFAELGVDDQRIKGDLQIRVYEARIDEMRAEMERLKAMLDSKPEQDFSEVQSLIKQHEIKMKAMIDVFIAKQKARAEVQKAKSLGMETQNSQQESAESEAELQSVVSVLQQQHEDFMKVILQLLTQKKQIVLQSNGGQITGAEVIPANG